MTQTKYPPVLSIVGFAVIGLFSFGLLCAALLVRPDALLGAFSRGPGLSLTHLTTLGWISSLLFAATYLVGPVLADSPLWSRRLPAVHLACHLLGLGLLIGAAAVLNYHLAATGAGLLVLGFLALLVNIYQTGSRRSVWTPANLAFHSAMFWLTITGVTALLMLHGRLGGDLPMSVEMLTALHAQYGLFGFLAQVLLAVSLRIVPEMLNPGKIHRAGSAADRLGWTGWACLNGGLLLLIPVSELGQTWALFAVALVVALGIGSFVIQIAVLLWQGRRRIAWPELTHATGIGLLAGIVVTALASYPLAAGAAEPLREWMRLYIALALLGPFAFAVFGVGQRLVPRLVWQLRLAPWSEHGRLPHPASLARPSAGGPVFFSLLLAWGYLAYGQWAGEAEAVRLGAILMLLAAGWFIIGIKPAIHRFVIGVTPEDLQDLPPAGQPAARYDEAPPTRQRNSEPASNLQPLTTG